MAVAGRDQKHLGIDSNVLVAYLDDDHPRHNETHSLTNAGVAINPTVLHEAYHTLVYGLKWKEDDASEVLKEIANDKNTRFINHSLRTVLAGLNIATGYHLRGRDALIVANFLTGGVSECRTFDAKLLGIGKIKYGRWSILFRRPI